MFPYKFNHISLIDNFLDKDRISDAKKMLDSDNNTSLRIKIDATHSGILTNGRVYPAVKVRDGYRTFFSRENNGLAEFDKPVLTHHDDYRDAIGRVVGGRFIPYKSGKDLEEDFLSPDMKDGTGSGVVEVIANIPDPDAIQKILDGRYLSVSSGHSTDAMSCSICGDSLFTCPHIPGRHYVDGEEEEYRGSDSKTKDARLCYGITNNMNYHEVSFVNIPAQNAAKVKEIERDFEEEFDRFVHEKESFDTKQALNSISRKGKDNIKSLVLCDNEREFDLISGKDYETNRNKVVCVLNPSTVDKLKETLSKDDDEPKNGPSSTPKQEDSKPTPTTQKVTKMDEDQKKMLDQLGTDLEKVSQTIDGDLATAQERIKELEAEVTAKDSEIETLNGTVEQLQKDSKLSLARVVHQLRAQLSKPDVKSLDSEEAREKYVTELAEKRSIDSLNDSVVDLNLELDNLPDEPEQKATDALEGGQVTSPIQMNDTQSQPAKPTSVNPLDDIV